MNIGASTPCNLPPLPSAYSISPSTVPGLFNVKFNSNVRLSNPQVQASILENVGLLAAAGTIPPTSAAFADYASHTPFELTAGTARSRCTFPGSCTGCPTGR
jgi:hypothetical protein